MAAQYNYTPLPSYADDVKAPLLSSHDSDGVVININQVEACPQDQQNTGAPLVVVAAAVESSDVSALVVPRVVWRSMVLRVRIRVVLR